MQKVKKYWKGLEQLKVQSDIMDKLEQNEELAELRADTAMAKTEMTTQAKLYTDQMKRKDVKTLKGPRR